MSSIAQGSLEYWANAKPDAVAVQDDPARLTFAEWNDAANRVAHALALQGIGAGDVVVLRTQIRHEWNILASALAKLGCSLLGLNWRLTAHEAMYVLENSGAAALVCDDPDPTPLFAAARKLRLKLCVSIDCPCPEGITYQHLLTTSAKPFFSQKDPPLVIYTSGTTGFPKGVTMGRGSKFFTPDQVMEYQRDVRSGRRSNVENAVVLVTMPVHHGSGPAQIWSALRSGRETILMRRFDPVRALQIIDQHKVTDWNAVPTMLKRIAALPGTVLDQFDVSSLRHLSVGAAPVPYALKEWVMRYFGENCLTEGYGATETGMVTRLTPDMQRAKPGSSGRPYLHVAIEVRNTEGVTLGPNQCGDLWIRTPTTIDRYVAGSGLDRDVLDERGFFRVGDVGHLDDEGFLYITDRAKDLIITGGVNVYPAEIEAAIIKHPSIQDVAVIGIPDDEYGEQVKAFCELKPGETTSVEALQSFLSDHLASYKRPKSIEFVAELPRNTMGKLLKRELRAPYWQNRERQV